MKIARFQSNKTVGYGLVEGDRINPIQGDIFGDFTTTAEYLPLEGLKLLPPTAPSKIICVGLNYLGHIREIGDATPKRPSVFLKPDTCLIGNGDPIVIPPDTGRIDHEGELAVVFKHAFRNATEKEALDHVLGYACFNDVTERSLTFEAHNNLTIAKSFDTFGPFGPWLSTEVDPWNTEIATRVNGEVKQKDNTGNCIFSVPYLIRYVSWCMTILPGDVLITGTPSGVSEIKSGDKVEVEIEGIGTLVNPVQG